MVLNHLFYKNKNPDKTANPASARATWAKNIWQNEGLANLLGLFILITYIISTYDNSVNKFGNYFPNIS